MTLEKKHLPFIAASVIVIWAGIIIYCVMLLAPGTAGTARTAAKPQASLHRTLVTILTRPDTALRDPFQSTEAGTSIAVPASSPGIGLSAVSWDNVAPQALIYKTGAEQQTQLVHREDAVFGIKILQIYRDSIIILAHGRKFRIYNSYWEQISE